MQRFEEKPPDPLNLVSVAEISNFTQGQENQGIMRPALKREQIIPQIDAEITEKGNFWMETIELHSTSQ